MQLTQIRNTRVRGDCFGYKIAVQIECLQIFHLTQNIAPVSANIKRIEWYHTRI